MLQRLFMESQLLFTIVMLNNLGCCVRREETQMRGECPMSPSLDDEIHCGDAATDARR